MKSILSNKKGQFQLATGAIWGVVAFMLAAIVGILVVSTLAGGGFFTAGSAADVVVQNISTNLTTGIGTVSSKLPTIFVVVGIAIVLAIVAILVLIVRRSGMTSGGGNFAQ